ncbi:MAG: hypothetical protein JW954_05690 [Dehalococcoidaceae bacterium]|nr:hypothetical protein [Dehalococcoidaceae bacterium]
MTNFRNKEKERYELIKDKNVSTGKPLFSSGAQMPGCYNGIYRTFCLHDDLSDENLYGSIRESAKGYFAERGIPWHKGLKKGSFPSNHLCCSQSCCMNFLFPMADKPLLLKAVFNHSLTDIDKVLPLFLDGSLPNGAPAHMAFEWIGERDYLGEHIGKRGARTRGANYTSADFAFRYKSNSGIIKIVIGEWKYTEEYGYKDFLKPSNAKDKKPEVRYRTYKPLFEKSGGIFAKASDDFYRSLFFDPFYQLMRLQLLAQEMEAHHEMDAEVVSVVHISPKANLILRNRITSPYLESKFAGRDIYAIWESLLTKDRFNHLSVEELRSFITKEAKYADEEWVEYLNTRYGWK